MRMQKLIITLNIWLYRLLGGGPMAQKLLILTTRGRKTGKERTIPLRYMRDGDSFIVIASNAGREQHPGWYFNVQANPIVEVQVGARRFQARAETVQGDERERLWKAFIAESRGYEGMQQKNRRVFPLVRLMPK